MNDKLLHKLTVVFILASLTPGIACSQNLSWTHFRGNNLNGISSAVNIPLEWNESNTRWKTALHGNGHSSPVVSGNQVWVTTATSDCTYAEMVAVNPDGKGDITATNILWKKRDDQAHTQMLTPVVKDGLIYTVNTRNYLMCIDAGTGKEIWSERLRSDHNASPVIAEDLVWFFSVKGEVTAIRTGRKPDIVSRIQMDSGIWGTPAFLGESVVLRTEKFLYRIEK